MKLGDRLLSCAELVKKGNIAADIGADHAYLSIYLLEKGICPHVYVSDLREMPLAAGMRNAIRAGITENITFCLSDGLKNLPMEQIETIICAGMGGDNIIGILSADATICSSEYQLILQPQSSVHVLRRWLSEQGFSVIREKLSQEGRFIYTAMEVYYGKHNVLSPGQQFIPDILLKSGDPLLPTYFSKVKKSVQMSVDGLHKSKYTNSQLLDYYETAFAELNEMGSAYGLNK